MLTTSIHKYTSLLASVFDVLSSITKPVSMTSLDVVQQVMNVPHAAVEAIAREANIDVVDSQSECIDENSLGVFADAYIRKFHAYFNRITHSRNHVGYDDLSAFDKFCITFKKPNCNKSKAESWDDIDQNAIREEFLEQVKEKTPHRKSSLCELFGRLGSIVIARQNKCSEIRLHQDWRDAITETNNKGRDKKYYILQTITHSLVYSVRHVEELPSFEGWDNSVRQVMIAAHYYIYARSDKEDHNQDTVSANGHNDFMFNSVPKTKVLYSFLGA